MKRQVEMDLLLMKFGSWLLHCLPGLKWLSLYEIVEEFEKLMTRQVGKVRPSCLKWSLVFFILSPSLVFQIDLRFEARNIQRFRENFRNVDYVKFPTPLQPFVTRTVLVETFEVSANMRAQSNFIIN